jgi:hypothetical protein
MAQVPSTTRFIGIADSVDLTERKSAQANTETEPYTMQDIADSTGIQTVLDGLTAQGTSNATTSVMEYAVNIFTTATVNDDSTKLPQPTTGKTTKIINNSSRIIRVYPSNIGGKINNLAIDEPILIPNDGKVYEFICTENPLPGNWNTVSAPGTSQIVLAEIDVAHTTGTVTYASGISNATLLFGPGNMPYMQLDGAGNFTIVGSMLTELLPTTLTKTKVYTNILDTDLSVDDINFEMRTWTKSSPTSTDQWTAQNILLGLGNGDEAISGPLGGSNVGDLDTYYREDLPNFGVFPSIGAPAIPSTSISGHYYFFLFYVPASAATKTYKFQIILETL